MLDQYTTLRLYWLLANLLALSSLNYIIQKQFKLQLKNLAVHLTVQYNWFTMKKILLILKKTTKILALPAGAFLAFAVLSYLFLADFLELDQKITDLINKEVGIECSIGEIRVILLPKPGLLLRDVIFMPQGSSINSHSATLKSVPQAPQSNASTENTTSELNENSLNATQENSRLATDSASSPELLTNSTNSTANSAQTSDALPAPDHPETPSLYIKRLAIYLDIIPLLEGKIEPTGARMNGLSLYLTNLDKLNDVLNKVVAKATPPSSTEDTPKVVVIEKSKAQIVTRLWELLQSVSLLNSNVYILNDVGKPEILFGNVKLSAFLGKLSLSFLMHPPVNDEPYSIGMEANISNFNSDFDNVTFNLEAIANDQQGFNPKINTLVRFDEKEDLIFLNNFQIKTGKTSLSSDIVLTLKPDDENLSWHAKGPATISNFDLPRWVPPLLKMSPEAQTLLAQINGELELELNPNGLYLNKVKAVVGPYTWTGTGSITDFTKDLKLYFNFKTNELPLEALFPQLADSDLPPRFTKNAPSFNQPHFLSGDISNAPKLELILGVETLIYRNLRIGDVTAIMHNNPLNVHWEISATNFAGSKLKAVILDNDDYTIDVNGKLAGIQIGTLLPGMDWDLPIHGTASSSFRLKGRTDSLDNFLETIQLEFQGKGENILFASSLTPANPKQRDFNRFEQLDFNTSFRGAPTNDNKLNALIHLDAQFKGKQFKDILEIQTKGPVMFDTNSMMQINGLEFNGQITSDLSFMGFDSKPQTGPLKGNFTCSQENESFKLNIISLSLAGLDGTTQIEGKDIGHNPKISGATQLKSTSLRKFLTKMDVDVSNVPEPLLKEASAQANFTTTETPNGMIETHISNIKAGIDHISLTAEAWHGPDDETRIELTTSEIDLDAYWPSKENPEPSPPAKPWNVSAWLKKDLNFELKTPKIIYKKLPNEDVFVKTTVGKGKLLTTLNSTTCGGDLTINFVGNDKAGLLNSNLSLRFENASLEKITKARSGEIKASGNLEVSLDVSGNLSSMDDIPNALNGQWAFNIGKGYFVRSQAQTGKIKEDTSATLSNFDFVKGTGQIRLGVLYTEDLLMDGPSTHMTGEGKIDLVNDKIDIHMNMRMGGVSFPVAVVGDLSDPTINLKGGKFITHNIGNIGGGLLDLIGGVVTLPFKIIELGTE